MKFLKRFDSSGAISFYTGEAEGMVFTGAGNVSHPYTGSSSPPIIAPPFNVRRSTGNCVQVCILPRFCCGSKSKCFAIIIMCINGFGLETNCVRLIDILQVQKSFHQINEG